MALEGSQCFVVRRAKSLDDLRWVIQLEAQEGFTLREREAECYFTAELYPNFFIGELNGERISCVSVVRHGETVAFVGNYIVVRAYRGQGYGLKTWEAALDGVGDRCNAQLFSVVQMKNQYQKSGFQPGWMAKRYTFTASRALEGLASIQLPSSVAQILPACEVDFEKVFAYGANMLGTSRTCKSVLAGWLSHAQESSWVALDSKSEVVGYLIMSRTVCFSRDGYRVAPFFADSAPIARSLLKVAAAFASDINPEDNMTLDFAADYNQDAVCILENEVGTKPLFETLFMATKELPIKQYAKVFGIGSMGIM